MYDSVNNRFIVVTGNAGSNGTISNIDIAVSKDSNPNDGWNVASLNTSLTINGQLTASGQPIVSADGQNIYISAPQYNVSGGGWQGTETWVIGDTAGAGGGIYNGGALTVAANQVASPTQGNFQVVAGNNGMSYFASTYSTGNNTVVNLQTYNVATNTFGPDSTFALGNNDQGTAGASFTAQQQGTNLLLDAGDSQIRSLAYANGFIYGVSEVKPVGSSVPVVHWFKIDVSNSSSPVLVAQGDISGAAIGPNVATFDSSIAVNGGGDVIINFTASGPNMYPADYYVFGNASNPTYSFSAPILYQGSTGYFNSGNGATVQRWGPNSTATTDPNNPHTFWISGEYIANGAWQTSVAQVTIQPISAPPAPAGLALDAATDSGTKGDGITSFAQVTIDGTAEAGSTVTLYDSNGTTVLGSGLANAAGAFSIATTALAGGLHTITAKATDAAGNTGPASSAYGLTVTTSGSIINTDVAGPITLSAANNPLTITNAGTATSTASGVNGINGGTGSAWTVINSGKVSSSTGFGVYLSGPGTVSTDGLISGKGGLALGAGGTVTNSGSIVATGAVGGGSGQGAGVLIKGAAGSVTNSGTINGQAYGVALDAGGMVTNTSAIIGGQDGIRVIGAIGTVANSGSIVSNVDNGIAFFAGGSVSNSVGGSISNAGSKGAGIYITGGAGGTVTNSGSISGIDRGVDLGHGGTVTNNTGGSISSHRGVDIQGGAGVVTNSGSIAGTTRLGVRLSAGGQVTNTVGGSISGPLGVAVYGAAGTVTNYGTISGSSHAVTFNGTGANRLVVGATSTISGDVVGSTTSGATNTLELAGGAGTLSNLTGGGGTATENGQSWAFKNFNTIIVDGGANWSVNGKNTIASVVDNGTLTISGGGSLTVATAVDPSSTGLFTIGNGATLEVKAAAGSLTQMSFLTNSTSNSTLIVDDFSNFGLSVGASSYAGPLLEYVNGAADRIDLKTFNSAGVIATSFNASSGLLQLTNAAQQKATLEFQTSTLGTGSFHFASDGSTGLLLTHS